MSAELVAILAVGVALAGLIVGVLRGLRADMRTEIRDVRAEVREVRSDVGDLRERMARMEGLFEGFRERMSRIEGLFEGIRERVSREGHFAGEARRTEPE